MGSAVGLFLCLDESISEDNKTIGPRDSSKEGSSNGPKELNEGSNDSKEKLKEDSYEISSEGSIEA